MPQKPSVGRDVHYVSAGSADGRFPSVCRAATVTEVGALQPHVVDGKVTHHTRFVSLEIHNPTGVHFAANVPSNHTNHGAPYTWHWPEFESEQDPD